MDRWSKSSFAGLAVLLGLCLSIAPASANDAAYCSPQNTAGDFDALQDNFQSHGWCTDACNKAGKYAFAVVLEKNCWCSNYIPEDQRDVGNCNDDCPGFPFEKCGSQADSLYSYVKLKNDPSGTVGGSQPTSASVSPSSTATALPSSTEATPSSEAMTPSSAPPSPPSTAVETSRESETVLGTVTASRDVTTLTPSLEPTPTTLRTTIIDEPAPPQTSVRVITESGAIITQTVITTPTSAPVQQTRKSSSNTGIIVGSVVGGVAGIIALSGSIFFIFWRRRQQKQEEDPQTGVQRNTSTMSKAGLLRTEKAPQFPSPIVTNFNRRQSRNLDQDSISPVSGSDRRNSRHMVDQRLNPSTIFVFENNSTGSVGSVDDSRDYHRPLNVRNPDPDA